MLMAHTKSVQYLAKNDNQRIQNREDDFVAALRVNQTPIYISQFSFLVLILPPDNGLYPILPVAILC